MPKLWEPLEGVKKPTNAKEKSFVGKTKKNEKIVGSGTKKRLKDSIIVHSKMKEVLKC